MQRSRPCTTRVIGSLATAPTASLVTSAAVTPAPTAFLLTSAAVSPMFLLVVVARWLNSSKLFLAPEHVRAETRGALVEPAADRLEQAARFRLRLGRRGRIGLGRRRGLLLRERDLRQQNRRHQHDEAADNDGARAEARRGSHRLITFHSMRMALNRLAAAALAIPPMPPEFAETAWPK